MSSMRSALLETYRRYPFHFHYKTKKAYFYFQFLDEEAETQRN